MDGQAGGVGGDGGQMRARRLSRQRDHGLDFRVVRETPGSRQVDRRAASVRLVFAFAGGLQRRREAMGIAQEEVGRIDEQSLAAPGDCVESAQHRPGERGLDGQPLGRIVTVGDVVRVVLDQEYARTGALKPDEA